MKKHKLIIFSGSSGVGKKTILSKLLLDESLKLKYSVSLTTRKPRAGEKDGEDYFFVSNEEFNRYIENDELLEWAEFIGNKYGTPKKFIIETLESGYSPLLEIEVKGALDVMKKYNQEYLSIFIVPPSIDELRKRLEERNTEDSISIKKRLNEAVKEIQESVHYQHVVVNDNLDEAVEKIRNIIKNEI